MKQQTLILTNYLVTVELHNWTHLVEAPAETKRLSSKCSSLILFRLYIHLDFTLDDGAK